MTSDQLEMSGEAADAITDILLKQFALVGAGFNPEVCAAFACEIVAAIEVGAIPHVKIEF